MIKLGKIRLKNKLTLNIFFLLISEIADIVSETNKDQESRFLVNTTSRLQSKRASVTAAFGIDPKITMMVLAVVLAFFICQFPYLLLRLVKLQGFYFNLAKTVCDILLVLNCCINFLIYCFFGQNFRMIAKTMLLNPSYV